MTDNKSKVKNLISRAFQGKISQTESENIRKNLLNYDLAEWLNLISIGKELAKEKIDEEVQKLPEEDFPGEWKSLTKDWGHALVDLFCAIFNEEVFYQATLLEKQSGLSQKEKVLKMLPILAQQMDKVAARANPKKLSESEYYRAEVKVTKKFKKVFREIRKSFLTGDFRRIKKGNVSEEKIKQKVGQLLKSFENLSVDEIVVLKEKMKLLIKTAIKNYAPSEIKNSPEISQFINSFLNLICASGDERLTKDAFDLAVKVGKIALQNPKLFEPEKREERRNDGTYSVHHELNIFKLYRKVGVEAEVKSLFRNITLHLNKLAGQGEKNEPNLPVNQEEIITKLITQLPDQPDNPNPEENTSFSLGSFGGLIKNNALTKNAEDVLTNATGSPEKDWSGENFFKDVEEILTETQSKGKWYQRTWIIVSLVAGAFLIGGLVVWLLLRKKNQPVSE